MEAGTATHSLTVAAVADLRAFHDTAYDQAFRYLARLTGGDRALTEDLVQDVMLSVARDLAAGRSPRHDPAWIVTVGRNRFLNHVRSEQRAAKRLSKATDRSTQAGGIGEPDASDRARALLAQLPLEQRAAVILRHLDGYSTVEIAQQLGRSVEATESLIARGIKTLRSLGEENG